MPDETHELIVSVRPEGTEETKQELDGVSDEFEQTADETERTAGILGDMSTEMKGVAGVVVGTLTTLAAGIASQVPILQENADALGAVITAIALRVDEDLRPSIGLLNLEMFELSDAILRDKDVLNELLDVVGTALIVFGELMPGQLGKTATQVGILFREADRLAQLFADLPSDIQSGLQTLRGIIHRNLVMPVIDGVNDALDALNKLPGVDVGGVAPPPPPRAPGTPKVPETGGGEDFGVQGGGGQLARTLQTLANARHQTTVQLDGRTIAESQERLLGSSVAGAGRVFRTR